MDNPDCNATTPNSLWKTQRPYIDPAINKLMTCDAWPEFGECTHKEDGEILHARNEFSFDEDIHCVLFLKDQDMDSEVNFTLLRPDGTTYYENTLNCQTTPLACNYFDSSWWVYTFNLPIGVPCGAWSYRVDFHDQTAEHTFFLGGLREITAVGGQLIAQPAIPETYQVVDPVSDSRYFWTVENGEIMSGQNTSEVEIRWSEGDQGVLCVVQNTPQGCAGEQFCITIDLASTNASELSSSEFLIYPNPVYETLHILDDRQTIDQLIIYDLTGNRLRTVGGSDISMTGISLSDLIAGTYLLVIKSANHSTVHKLLKL